MGSERSSGERGKKRGVIKTGVTIYSRSFCIKKEQDDPTPDLDLVADVIDHIHTHGEPGERNTHTSSS